ncbi:hypothetical protein AbD4_01738 [Acinetobacter baumannii]|nr:hypothetical protein KPZ59_01744 [Acinetobacter baumannii]QUX87496.1 hypothetical protein AbD4_01738 [Acinetobacter baumannii]RIX05008.1 hypothetical protein D3X28_19820 [Acinetobacter baumannii]
MKIRLLLSKIHIRIKILLNQIEYLKNLKIILSSFYNIRLNKIMFLIMINLIKILKSISSNN